MKSNILALTILSGVCFLLPELSPSHAMHYEFTKGGDSDHEHGTPSISNTSEESISNTPEEVMPTETSATEESSEGSLDGPHNMIEGHSDDHGSTHGGVDDASHHGGVHGGIHGGVHGGVHGGQGGMMASEPWFHHGAIEVSEVFYLSRAQTENGSESVLELEDLSKGINSIPMPSVMVMIHPDDRKGWNIEVQTEHFTFTPEQVNDVNQPNVGHGHLYMNGEKITRLYSNWFYLDHLDAGTHEITVSLHANGHEVWTHEGEAIAHTTTIEVQ